LVIDEVQEVANTAVSTLGRGAAQEDGMAKITIDGKSFIGANVTIRNGVISIDGKVQDGTLNGVVEIRIVEGVLEKLETDASVTCGAVSGDVAAGGSVNCESVGGDIRAGGSVNARGPAGGSIRAGGSVNLR
jgi:hypothetical protein